MAKQAIVNASPLILLAKAHSIELLRLAGDEILIPAAVAQEIRARPSDDLSRQALEQTPWIQTAEIATLSPLVLAWDLGAGESAVLSYALANPGCPAVLDDLAARRCASVLAIPVHGTLGLALLAKQRGVIAAARPLVDRLRQSGMYLSDKVTEQALRFVGE